MYKWIGLLIGFPSNNAGRLSTPIVAYVSQVLKEWKDIL